MPDIIWADISFIEWGFIVWMSAHTLAMVWLFDEIRKLGNRIDG